MIPARNRRGPGSLVEALDAKTSAFNKPERCRNDRAVAHQKRMRDSYDDVLFHSVHFGPLDRDFTIVGTGNHKTVDPIDRPLTGDYTELKMYRPEQARNRVGTGTK